MAHGSALNRREFLLLRLGAKRGAMELSCEQLFMKYVDAEATDRTIELFARLESELAAVQSVRLMDTDWLAHDDFRRALDRVLDSFRAAGRTVTGASVPA